MSTQKVFALLIGINYVNNSNCRLNGCWNDAMLLYSILTSKYSFPLECVKLLIDNDPKIDNTTKNNLIIALLDLSSKSWSQNLDKVVISYSGHGTYIPDRDGDETDGKDECLCPSDFSTSGVIKDDDLLTILRTFNPKTKIFVIADCCHSGTILDLPFTIGIENEKKILIDQHIISLSGCMDPQTSAEVYDSKMNKYGGVLTSSLVHILSTNPSIGLIDLHKELTRTIQSAGYTQKPILSSSKFINNKISLF